MQYFARPTIDRLFELQKSLQEQYNLFSDADVQPIKNLEKEDVESNEGKEVRDNLPDPLNSKKIEKSPVHERRKIPKTSLNILKSWLLDHIDDPYPSNQEKRQLAQAAKLTFKQVSYSITRIAEICYQVHNWFINARGRGWKQVLKREKFSQVVEKKLLDINPNAMKTKKAKEYA